MAIKDSIIRGVYTGLAGTFVLDATIENMNETIDFMKNYGDYIGTYLGSLTQLTANLLAPFGSGIITAAAGSKFIKDVYSAKSLSDLF